MEIANSEGKEPSYGQRGPHGMFKGRGDGTSKDPKAIMDPVLTLHVRAQLRCYCVTTGARDQTADFVDDHVFGVGSDIGSVGADGYPVGAFSEPLACSANLSSAFTFV